MSISVVGTAGAAATTIGIPAHQPGDMIIMVTRRASNTPAGVPSSGPTVPVWTTIQSAGANTLAMTAAYTIATLSTHTSGTWGLADQMICIVLRSSTGTLSLGASSLGNANNTQTIVYPALTLQKTDGTSMGVRCGTRVTADNDVATAPSGWSTWLAQPITGGTQLMAVAVRAALAANPTADSVATPPTNAAYRAYTIEVLEVPPPTPLDQTLIDDFNRADGPANAGAGAAIWQPVNSYGYTDDFPLIKSNLLAGEASGVNAVLSKRLMTQNFDLLVDCVNPGTIGPSEYPFLALSVCISNAPGPENCFYFAWSSQQSQMWMDLITNGSYVATGGNVAQSWLAANETVWLAKRGTSLSVYRRPSGGVFTQVYNWVRSEHNAPGNFEIRLGSDAGTRWDNLRGGPFVPLPKSVVVI